MTPQTAQALALGATLPRPARLNVTIVAIGATREQVMIRLPNGDHAWVSTHDLEMS